MTDKQSDILKWWYGRRDYATGTALLSRFCKNKIIINTLIKPGKEKFIYNVHKLHYELTKSVGLDWKNMPKNTEPDTDPNENGVSDNIPEKIKPFIEINPEQKTVQPDQNEEDYSQYPKVIRRLLYESSSLYKQRSKLHTEMKTDDSNSDTSVENRKNIFDQIKSISKKLENYFLYIDNYKKTGEVPEEETVWPKEKTQEPEKPPSLEELRKIKWALRRENAKDRNKLLYQQRTKVEKENPMPAGPKRDAIENRIAAKEEKIIEIDNQIEVLENAGEN